MIARAHSGRAPRRAGYAGLRGAILLEVLIALALLTGGGMLMLDVIGNAYHGLARSRQLEFAADLARSKLAELEAGLIPLDELDGTTVERIGSIDLVSDSFSYSPHVETWLIEVETSRTAFAGVTDVAITVRLDDENDPEHAPSATARQLMRLRDAAFDEYEEDPLMRGLPEGGER